MTPPAACVPAGSGGFFVDVTVHDLDVARWLVGEVVEVTAHGAASDPAFAALGDIDTAVVVLRFENGALGVIDNSRSARYGYECSTEVMGTPRPCGSTRRSGRYEWRTPGPRRYALPATSRSATRRPTPPSWTRSPAACCDGTPPRVTGHDALAAFDLAGRRDGRGVGPAGRVSPADTARRVCTNWRSPQSD